MALYHLVSDLEWGGIGCEKRTEFLSCRSCLGAVFFGSLFFTFPPEDPVDKNGKIDVIGALLGLSGLLLFSVAWK